MWRAGTHDNETVVGWWKGSASEGEKGYFKEYLGVDGKDPAWALLQESLKSVSQTAIMLMQVSCLSFLSPIDLDLVLSEWGTD